MGSADKSSRTMCSESGKAGRRHMPTSSVSAVRLNLPPTRENFPGCDIAGGQSGMMLRHGIQWIAWPWPFILGRCQLAPRLMGSLLCNQKENDGREDKAERPMIHESTSRRATRK